MNHFFRLIWIWLTTKRHTTSSKDTLSCQRTFRVLPTDLDVLGHMTNSRYVSLMDTGRVELILASGLINEFKKNKIIPIVQSVLVTFFQELKLFERFELKTEIIFWDDRYLYIRQEFYKNETLIAKGLIRGCFLQRGKRISPEELLTRIAPHTKSPEEPAEIQSWLQTLKASPRK